MYYENKPETTQLIPLHTSTVVTPSRYSKKYYIRSTKHLLEIKLRYQRLHYHDKILYKRLLARGHKSTTILPIFTNAAPNKSNKTPTKTAVENTPDRIFFHIPYHPQDVS